MTEETNMGVPAAPSIPSDIYTPFDPTENDVETIPAIGEDHADKDVKQPRLNAEAAPNSPQAPEDRAGDSDRPDQRVPGSHAFDRGFEYDDEDAA